MKVLHDYVNGGEGRVDYGSRGYWPCFYSEAVLLIKQL